MWEARIVWEAEFCGEARIVWEVGGCRELGLCGRLKAVLRLGLSEAECSGEARICGRL